MRISHLTQFTYQQKRGIVVKTKKISTKGLLLGAFISIALLVSIAGGVLLALFGNKTKERDIIIIPSFVGQKYAELEPCDRISFESELVYSKRVPKGEIISQEPYSGARRKVADGECYTVKLTVSMGAEEQKLPDLSGVPYTEAASALRALGVQIRVVSVYDGDGDGDRVLYTSPDAGAKINRGDRVTLFVCRKHVKGSVRVSDLSGLDKGAACTKLLAEGLLVGEIVYAPSDTAGEGIVISQSIAPGSYVRYHSKINITVSTGKEDKNDQLHPFGRYIDGGEG